MGHKKPGPQCATHSPAIDRGTLCTHRTATPGPTGANAANDEAAKPARVAFSALWDGYPSGKPYLDAKTGAVPAGFDNQCAIKVSVALHSVGIEMKSFHGAQVTIAKKRAAIRAEELASWLQTQSISGITSPPTDVTGAKWQDTIKGKTGIVFFANYWARTGETKATTGDHIDLWNGSRLTATSLEGVAVAVMRFGFGVNSGPGFSDLGKATKILFWEVK